MKNAGLLDFVHEKGIEWLNVFAVDNVLQRIADPLFLGATLDAGCNVGAKVVRKNHPDEKVGVMCLKDNHPSIIEYYELTEKLRDTVDENGERVYNFGVILNYLFEVKSTENIMNRMYENQEFLLHAGVLERENTRWPDYKMSISLERLEDLQKRRMEWLDTYFANF